MSEGDDQSGYPLREAAARLGLSVRQARRYVLDGRLPAVLVPGPRGREYRVSGADVDALAAERIRLGTVREPTRIVSSRELVTLASPDASRIVSDHLAALERAWQRIAELEAENGRLRGQLTAGTETPEPATREPRSLRERAARLFGR